jgi:hypothetical protein
VLVSFAPATLAPHPPPPTQITKEDLAHAEAALGEFGGDNRAGVEGTLHRISAIRNRKGAVVGLTCRVGRAVTGHIDMIRDILAGGLPRQHALALCPRRALLRRGCALGFATQPRVLAAMRRRVLETSSLPPAPRSAQLGAVPGAAGRGQDNRHPRDGARAVG